MISYFRSYRPNRGPTCKWRLCI